jgi:hypothetical protein
MNEDNRTLWIVLAVLAVFVVCLIVAVIAVLWYYSPKTPSESTNVETIVAQTMSAIATDTQPTDSPPTDSFEPSSTVTMIPLQTTKVATASATPTYTITPIPSHTPTFIVEDPRTSLGQPTWQDNFDDERNWTLFDDVCFKSEIGGGKYVMTSKSVPSATCWEVTWPRIKNFYLETTSITTDECEGTDRFGMIFRAPDPSQGYLFGLTCDGSYGMARWDPEAKQWDFFVDFTPSEHINAGPNQTNRIGVKADGERFGLYINGSLITEVTDDTYPDEGIFGYFIGATETEDFQVKYDELAYWDRP